MCGSAAALFVVCFFVVFYGYRCGSGFRGSKHRWMSALVKFIGANRPARFMSQFVFNQFFCEFLVACCGRDSCFVQKRAGICGAQRSTAETQAVGVEEPSSRIPCRGHLPGQQGANKDQNVSVPLLRRTPYLDWVLKKLSEHRTAQSSPSPSN